VPAREVRREGVGRAVAAIPEGARVAVCLDLDGLDPSAMPSVIARAPGGLSHWDVLDLVEGVAGRAEIVAVGVVEMMPDRDVDGLGAQAAAMLVASILGIVAPG
jgi:agmatinase